MNRKKFLLLLVSVSGWFALLAQTTLPTFWDFSNPGINTPPNGWTTGLGVNGNLTYSGSQNSVGGDGISARLDATGEFISIWFAERPGPLSYWIKGTGISPNPAFTGEFQIQESVDGNTWNVLRSLTSLTGTMTRYVDNPSTNARYVRFFYANKQPGSNIALDSVVLQAAPAPPTPSMRINAGGQNYINGAEFVVGNRQIFNFNIENRGSLQPLIITNANFSGNAAGDYQLNATLPDTIAAGSFKNYTCSFNAANNGSRKAQLVFACNDPENANYALNLYGIGGNYATEPAAQPTNLSFGNVRSFGFNVSFTAPNVAPEGYIALVKTGGVVTETPVDGVTYKRGDAIGNARVAWVGNAPGGFNNTYITANTTYHYAVFAFNGPAGYENYLTTDWLEGSITTPGKMPSNYYAGINPYNSNFISNLTQKINPHDTVFYSQYIARVINIWLARDTTNARKVVSCVYTGAPYVYEDPFLWWTGTNNGVLTREHTYSQSWMPTNQGNPYWPNAPGTSRELPEYNDLHNLFPANQTTANAIRSNNPFGNVLNATYTSPTGFGKLGSDGTRTVYEPHPNHKGDVARALFYMCVAYHNVNGFNWSLPANQNLQVLRDWHMQDPPDAHEIARNELIFSFQRNRNPFIDFPEWANRINFSNMTYIPDSNPPAPQINIIAPNANSNITVNTITGIKWQSFLVDTVEILVSYNNNPFTTIATNIWAYADSFAWQVGSDIQENVRIIVKDKNSNNADTSDYFAIKASTSVNELNVLAATKVFPNPFNNRIMLQFTNSSIKDLTIALTDIAGKELYKKENIMLEPNGLFTIENLAAFGNGVYFLHLYNARQRTTCKLVK
jgi:endonuclease I